MGNLLTLRPLSSESLAIMAAYFFASPIDVDVKLEGEEVRKQVEMKGEKERSTSCPVYYDGDSIGGQVSLSVPSVVL